MKRCQFWNLIRGGGGKHIGCFICMLGCLSPLGAAGGNPAIGTARQKCFGRLPYSEMWFSRVLEQRLSCTVELGVKNGLQEKKQRSLRCEGSYLWLAVKSRMDLCTSLSPAAGIPNPWPSSSFLMLPSCPHVPGSFQPLAARGSEVSLLALSNSVLLSIFIHGREIGHFGNLVVSIRLGWAWPLGTEGTGEDLGGCPGRVGCYRGWREGGGHLGSCSSDRETVMKLTQPAIILLRLLQRKWG